MAKPKHQLPSRDEASPSTPAVVLSSRDAKRQESLRQRIDKLPRAAKGKPGQEPKRLWSADPGLQDEVVEFFGQQRAKRTRAEIAANTFRSRMLRHGPMKASVPGGVLIRMTRAARFRADVTAGTSFGRKLLQPLMARSQPTGRAGLPGEGAKQRDDEKRKHGHARSLRACFSHQRPQRCDEQQPGD